MIRLDAADKRGLVFAAGTILGAAIYMLIRYA